MVLTLMAAARPPVVQAKSWLDDYQVNVFGIDVRKAAKGQYDITGVISGAVLSFVIHECGHLLIGRIVGMKTSVGQANGSPTGFAVLAHYKPGASRSQKAAFFAGGFVFQAVAGTIINQTKYKSNSFSFGFNCYSAVNTFLYCTLPDSRTRPTSDIGNLNRLQPGMGDIIGITTAYYLSDLTRKNIEARSEWIKENTKKSYQKYARSYLTATQ